MTGKRQRAGAVGSRQDVVNRGPVGLPTAVCGLPSGFTLLELMIVITVIIILAAITLPQYQKTILATREAVLRDDLSKMRTLLDQYAADKQKLPQQIDDLVTAGYMRELPVDPMTGKPDWNPDLGDDPNSTEQGIVNVHSSSSDVSSEGTEYNSW